MKSVIVAWCNASEKEFENSVPLKFVGNRNKKLGYSNNFEIIFLNGFTHLSEYYKNDLKSLGYNLHDCSKLFALFNEKYKQLDRFGDYEKKCFLRWLVIDNFFAGEKIIHYDGDIIFNEDPSVILKLLNEHTFVLQGCPAFTSISNRDWFILYKKELDKFVGAIDAYSMQAWQERAGWQITFKTRWAGSRFRPIITSDQDFISHLIHTNRIIQDSVEKIMMQLQDYVVFENPLFIHAYDDNFPFSYVRENGIDYLLYKRDETRDGIFKKRVLLWHMQSCFNFYLAKFVLREKLFRFLPLGTLKLNLFTKDWEDELNKKLNRVFAHTSRLSVYRYFFEKHDFSGIFTDKNWWKRGTFN